MKELQLTLSEQDQLDALLFSMSKSPQIIKARKKSRFMFMLLMLILAIPFFYYERQLAILIIGVSIIAFLFFPKYLGIYYKPISPNMSKALNSKIGSASSIQLLLKTIISRSKAHKWSPNINTISLNISPKRPSHFLSN